MVSVGKIDDNWWATVEKCAWDQFDFHLNNLAF